MNGKELVKLLEENGFTLVRVVGSHHRFSNGEVNITVPVHGSKDLKKGILMKILKEAGLK